MKDISVQRPQIQTRICLDTGEKTFGQNGFVQEQKLGCNIRFYWKVIEFMKSEEINSCSTAFPLGRTWD